MMVALARGIPSLPYQLFVPVLPVPQTDLLAIKRANSGCVDPEISARLVWLPVLGSGHTSEELDGHIGRRCDTGSVHDGNRGLCGITVTTVVNPI